MKKLKCLSLIMILSCIFVFAGCANIEYQRTVDDYGQILDKLTIEIDESKLKSDTNVDDLIDNVKHDIKTYYIDPILFRVELYKLQNPTTFHDFQKLFDISDIIYSKTGTMHKVSVEILFGSSEVMYYLYGYDISDDDATDSSMTETKNFFIKKYTQTTDNVFGDVTTIEFGGVNLFEKYQGKVGDEYNENDITLTQIYGTTDSRLHSNADETTTLNGITYHLWEFNGADASAQLMFYYITANATGWYALAIALTLVILVVIVAIYIVDKKKNKYKSKVVVDTQNSVEFDQNEDD